MLAATLQSALSPARTPLLLHQFCVDAPLFAPKITVAPASESSPVMALINRKQSPEPANPSAAPPVIESVQQPSVATQSFFNIPLYGYGERGCTHIPTPPPALPYEQRLISTPPSMDRNPPHNEILRTWTMLANFDETYRQSVNEARNRLGQMVYRLCERLRIWNVLRQEIDQSPRGGVAYVSVLLNLARTEHDLLSLLREIKAAATVAHFYESRIAIDGGAHCRQWETFTSEVERLDAFFSENFTQSYRMSVEANIDWVDHALELDKQRTDLNAQRAALKHELASHEEARAQWLIDTEKQQARLISEMEVFRELVDDF